MEEGGGADEIGPALEDDAPLRLDVFQFVDRREVAVDEDGVAERPEVLGGLEFRRAGGQEEQVDMLGDLQLRTRVPASAIQDEHDLLGRPRADRTGEGSQLDRAEGDGDAGSQVPQGPARGGMDKADAGAPRVAVLDGRTGPPSAEAPDLLEDGLEAAAVLVGRPELDLRPREGGGDGLDERADLFLKATCCSASASTWRGRGTHRLPLRRTR